MPGEPMNHTLKLFSHKPKVQHWRDVYKRQFAMNELLKSYVSSATIQSSKPDKERRGKE